MTSPGIENLRAELAAIRTVHRVARISRISGGTLDATGFGSDVALGDLIELRRDGGAIVGGEIVGLAPEYVTVLPEEPIDGMAIGDRVIHLGSDHICPDESWIGQVIDPYGRALDDAPILRGKDPRPLQSAAPNPAQRRGLGRRVETGLSVFNTMLPLVRGQRIGLFSGSGVGKSSLLAMLAQGVDADVVVIALIGERGREVREFVERVLGPAGMRRSIVVAATSDRSPLVRRRCAWAAMAIAEHFRDAGNHVLLLADSVTRFADAHREIALAGGEDPTLRGHPPSVAHLIPALCERAGPGVSGSGDITAIFTVLVAGSDLEEPIADILRGVLDGHVVLDRSIAERGRFPAIDVLRSISRALPLAATDAENALISQARQRLGSYEKAEMMVRAGLYQAGSDPDIDAAIDAWPKLDAFIARHEHVDTAASFEALRQCLQPVEMTSDEETVNDPGSPAATSQAVPSDQDAQADTASGQ